MDKVIGDLYLKLQSEYHSYIDKVKAMPPVDIIRNIDEIAATKDVYLFLTYPGNLDSGECQYLLSLDEPLRLMRDQWLNNDKEISESMTETINAICHPEDELDDEDEHEP